MGFCLFKKRSFQNAFKGFSYFPFFCAIRCWDWSDIHYSSANVTGPWCCDYGCKIITGFSTDGDHPPLLEMLRTDYPREPWKVQMSSYKDIYLDFYQLIEIGSQTSSSRWQQTCQLRSTKVPLLWLLLDWIPNPTNGSHLSILNDGRVLEIGNTSEAWRASFRYFVYECRSIYKPRIVWCRLWPSIYWCENFAHRIKGQVHMITGQMMMPVILKRSLPFIID